MTERTENRELLSFYSVFDSLEMDSCHGSIFNLYFRVFRISISVQE